MALPIADLTKIHRNGLNDRYEVGGRPQSLAWDPTGRYLAISFAEGDAIALFLTAINRHGLSIAPYCFVAGRGAEVADFICFRPKYATADTKTVLTVGWSSGRVQYFACA